MSKYDKIEEFIFVNDLDPDLKTIEIKCPDIPNDHLIHNYGAQESKQKYRPLEIPDRLKMLVNNARKMHTREPKKYPFVNDIINQELIRYRHRYEDVHRFILRQWERRTYGDWYFIKGKRIWIPPQMTYWLDAWKLDVGEPQFRMKDRKYFGLWWDTLLDENSYGIIEVTRRKDGKSVRAACLLFEAISRNVRSRGGIQSKNDTDAGDFFRNHVVPGMRDLPFYFQPIHQHNQKTPNNDIKLHSGINDGTSSMELYSEIDFRAAKPLAYDSTYLKCYISDEEGKLELYDAYERWEKVKPALRNHLMEVNGKSIHTSTVEDSGVYGLKKFKEMFFDSQYHERKEGSTKTGLSAIFYPAFEGVVVDEYGFDDIEAAKRKVDAEIGSTKKNTKNYYEKVRKNPRTLREAFIVNAGGCPFDKDILLNRSSQFFSGNPYLVTGDLVWKDNKPDTEVMFVKKPGGRFKLSYIPNEAMRNNKEWRKGSWRPKNQHLFIAGGDTFNFDKTEGEGSKGGGAVYMFHNPIMEQHIQNMPERFTNDEKEMYYLEHKTDRIVCTYSFRPDNGKKGYVEDMIKMCVFFGCGMFPEHNYTHIQDGFVARGYSGFLVHKFDVKKGKVKDKPGDFTNEDVKDKLFDSVDQYIIRNGENEFHNDFIDECLEVTYDTMTDFDLFTSCAYALYGASLLNYKREIQERRKKRVRESGVLIYQEVEVDLYD